MARIPGLLKFSLTVGLAIYLLSLGIGSAIIVVENFPSKNTATNRIYFPNGTPSETSAESETEDRDPSAATTAEISLLSAKATLSIDQALMFLALMAGITGSFLHTAQSLASYVGNRAFKASWALWYALRPWIGGVLGLTLFVTFSAGFVSGVDLVDPAAVVALGLLGGWFSKTSTDKLQEVFETLLKTDADKLRKDGLVEHPRPVLTELTPNPVPRDGERLTVRGSSFSEGATIQLNDDEIVEDYVTRHSDELLEVALGGWTGRPMARATVNVRVRNPVGRERLSLPASVVFEAAQDEPPESSGHDQQDG